MSKCLASDIGYNIQFVAERSHLDVGKRYTLKHCDKRKLGISVVIVWSLVNPVHERCVLEKGATAAEHSEVLNKVQQWIAVERFCPIGESRGSKRVSLCPQ